MKSFEFSAAGHEGSMESDDGCTFYKPFNKIEHEFYQMIEIIKNEQLPESNEFTIDQFLIPFYGKLDSGLGDGVSIDVLDEEMLRRIDETLEITNESFLVLKNIIFGYNEPIVLDIKLGRVLYDSECSLEKKKRMEKVSKNTTSGSLGFRICGLKIELGYNNNSSINVERFLRDEIDGIEYEKCVSLNGGHVLSFNKFFGRSLKDETVIEGFKIVFRNNRLNKEIQDELIKKFILRLEIFYNCLLDEEIRCISSSLLFVIEGDPKRWVIGQDDEVFNQEEEEESEGDDDNDNELHAPLSDLRWIDFAHSKFTKGEGYDEELLFGVENIINELNKMLLI